jgi:hypothetical protein
MKEILREGNMPLAGRKKRRAAKKRGPKVRPQNKKRTRSEKGEVGAYISKLCKVRERVQIAVEEHLSSHVLRNKPENEDQLSDIGRHCKENPIYIFLFWKLRGLSPNFHIHVSVSDLYIPRIGPHISLQQNRQTDPGNISISTYECRNWETEHYNSVLEITVSFLGIHKWEPDIYIGFSTALHLQCT